MVGNALLGLLAEFQTFILLYKGMIFSFVDKFKKCEIT